MWLLAVLAACGGDLDQPWDLDHDRIVAIRAEPPSILSGETSKLDGLLSGKGTPTSETSPLQVIVVQPESLKSALSQAPDGSWIVTAPDEPTLAAARTELGLEATDPVPLQLGVAFTATLAGVKTVQLGATAPNPTLGVMQFDGAAIPPPGTELVVGALVDVPMSVEALDTDDVNWLTSVGEMHDFDLPSAYLRVEEDNELSEGELAIVLRDDRGGVTWQVWPIRVE
jgi:hypothetical protein